MAQIDQDKRIDYIELQVDDVGVAKTFYSAVFDWKFTDYGPDYSSFEDGRLAGGLRGGEGAPTRGGVLVVIYARALEAMRDAIVFSGGKIVAEIFDFPGGRRFHFTDPAGNELAVWSDV